MLTEPAPSFAAVFTFDMLVFVLAGAAMLSIPVAARRIGADPVFVAQWRRRLSVGLIAWLGITKLLAASGLLARFDLLPPPMMLLALASFLLSTSFGLSRAGELLARGLPLSLLVGFQAFRIPLELLLYRLFLDGVVPPQMTYAGMNHDIVTGCTALLLGAWAAWKPLPRFVLAAWNTMGLVLLATIVSIAIASAPGPLRLFPNDPPNAIIATSPFVWLPTVLVQFAWLGHLLVWRRLRAER